MAFKRALWHSGLTYKNVCDACGTNVIYTDEALDFRPWFADGFVYCPKCKKPLRHNERLAVEGQDKKQPETFIIGNAAKTENTPDSHSDADSDAAAAAAAPAFCSKCGKAFGTDDRFCSGCGNKRV